MVTKKQLACVHFWIIEPANGLPNSWGECQKCHLGKLHINWSPSPGWGDGSKIQDNDKAKASAAAKRQERAAQEREDAAGLPKRKHVKKYGLA